MFERFTDRARRVVVLAQEEARLLNHNYIGTEHILLGLIHEGEGVAAKSLESLGISLEGVRSQVEEIILKMPALACVYQLVVSRDGHMDKLDVNVELRPEVASQDAGIGTAAAKELQHHIKSSIGISTRVNVLPPNSVERSAGKARRVIDQRPKA